MNNLFAGDDLNRNFAQEEFSVKITAVISDDGTYYYQWEEVEAQPDGTYATMVGGRVGDYDPTGPSGSLPTYETNNGLIAVDAVVRCRIRSATTGNLVFEVDAPNTNASASFIVDATSGGGSGPLSGTDDVWTDTGVSIQLGAAGLYLIQLTAEGFCACSVAPPSNNSWPTVMARLHDGTNVLEGSTGVVATADVVTSTAFGDKRTWGTHSATIWYQAVSDMMTIKVQVKNNKYGGTAVCALDTNAAYGEGVRIRYVRLSD